MVFNVFYRAHGCLGAGPVPLWPPPQGPGGASQGGGPAPMSVHQSLLSPLGFRIEIYDDFGVDFGSFWGRSWVPLGGHVRSFWRLFRPKLVPQPSSNRLIFQNVFVHEIVRFPILWGVGATAWRPQSAQDRSKMGP